jgi:hypothetical protein
MRSTQCAIQAVNKMAFNVEKRVTASSYREFIGFAFKTISLYFLFLKNATEQSLQAMTVSTGAPRIRSEHFNDNFRRFNRSAPTGPTSRPNVSPAGSLSVVQELQQGLRSPLLSYKLPLCRNTGVAIVLRRNFQSAANLIWV